MESIELNKLVDGWIALQKTRFESGQYEALFWAYEAVWNLVAAKPPEALEFILAVLKCDSSSTIMENLSAGPLEDLLVGHGSLLIEKIEEEAKMNPVFASLLGGVWKNRMDDSVWKRVVAIRNRSGWDGNP
ncbi:MAG: hypothetical protein QM796_09535 [Chthoniobacteraceae bacterium]